MAATNSCQPVFEWMKLSNGKGQESRREIEKCIVGSRLVAVLQIDLLMKMHAIRPRTDRLEVSSFLSTQIVASEAVGVS